MAETFVPGSQPVGSFAAQVAYTRQHLVRMLTRKTFTQNITGPFETDKWAMDIKQSGKSTSSRGMPLVRVDDLSNTPGDQVTIDILDRIGGEPVMGDDIASDKAAQVSFIRDSLFINQYRKPVSAGGRMSQQRTVHDMREAAMTTSVDYNGDLVDNIVQVQLFGARGSATGKDWKVPLASSPNFARIMCNTVLPPTPNRYFGTTAAVTDPSLVSTTNVLTLNFFDDLRTFVQTGQVPFAGIRLQADDGTFYEGENSPLLLSYISEEAWNKLVQDTSAQNLRTFLSNATERLAWTKHPLFRSNNCGLWNDVLICKAPRPIQFNPGDSISVTNTDGVTTTTVTAAVRMHRGILLGAQAAGMAYASAKRWTGNSQNSAGSGGGNVPSPALNLPFTWEEELQDGKNLLKIFTGFIGGVKKLKYQFDNVWYDNAVCGFDTYVPALR